VAIALEQKGIGQPFSHSVSVKKFVGVQTPAMKAVRTILTKPGCGFAKSAVLCGGPDWPTSVLTGILNLRLVDMLLGSLPVVFLIAPCCVAAAYILRASHEDFNERKQAQYRAMANVSLALSAILQGCASVLATLYIQAAMHKSEDGAWTDPQEGEILEEIKADNLAAEEFAERTRWENLKWSRGILVLGSLLSCVSVALLLNHRAPPFKNFDITDKVSNLDGGVLSVVNPSGWYVLGLMAAQFICLAAINIVFCRLPRADLVVLDSKSPSLLEMSSFKTVGD